MPGTAYNLATTQRMRMLRRVAALLSLLPVLLMAGLAQAEPFAYSVNSAGDSQVDSLFVIDLANGEAEHIGATGFADIEGLAFNSDGVLFAADDATNTLATIDLATGQGVAVDGRFRNMDLGNGPSTFDFGLTFTCTGSLVMSSDTENQLFEVDAETGVAIPVDAAAGTGAPLTALSSWGDQVYGIGSMGSENLYRVNPDTGTTELVGPLGSDLSFTDAGLAFDTEGVLWMVLDLSDQGFQPSPIYTIDVMTGEATYVAETVVGLESLAIAPPSPCEVTQGPITIPTLSPLGLLAMVLLLIGLAVPAIRQRI